MTDCQKGRNFNRQMFCLYLCFCEFFAFSYFSSFGGLFFPLTAVCKFEILHENLLWAYQHVECFKKSIWYEHSLVFENNLPIPCGGNVYLWKTTNHTVWLGIKMWSCDSHEEWKIDNLICIPFIECLPKLFCILFIFICTFWQQQFYKIQ